MKKLLTILIAILSVTGIYAKINEDVKQLLEDTKKYIKEEKYEAAISFYRSYVRMDGERVADIENILERYVQNKEKETNVSDNKLDYHVNNTVEIRTINYNNGDRYVGEVLYNLPNGSGIMYWNDGAKYIGEFKNGMLDGQGTYYWSDGSMYVGSLRNGVPEGYGTYYYTDGSSYEGSVVNGRKNGQGTYRWANGDRYVGKWKDDRRNGYGICYFKNGNRYEGEYKFDRRNGYGTMYYKDKSKKSGTWSNDILVKKQ